VRALLSGELRRTLSRRLVKVVFLLVALGIVVGSLITFFKTHSLSEAVYQSRVRSAQAQVSTQSGIPLCRPGQTGISTQEGPGPVVQPSCLSGGVVSVHDPRFHLTSLKGVFQGVTAPLVILALLIGASIIGAEWPSRTITTILTWEPRRLRVISAKVLAAILVGTALTLVALVVLGLVLLPSALLHGTTAGTTGAWWQSLGGVAVRSVAVTAIGATVGFSIASIGRNTAAALGVLFGYIVVIENVVAAFLHGLRRWLITGNAIVFVSGNPHDFPRVSSRSVTACGLYLGAIAVGLYIIAAVLFQRRDVA